VSALSPDDSLLLILRRLDEIERKLDRILEELRTPTAIGYSVRRGKFSNEGLMAQRSKSLAQINKSLDGAKATNCR
jgi:hypothetical protein